MRWNGCSPSPPAQSVRGLAAGEIERIFAAADEFDDGQGKIGELFRGGGAAAGQKTFERDGVRCGGELVPEFSREFDDARPAFGITQHAAEGRKFFRSEVNRGHGIRRHHELLDQLCRPVRLIQFERSKRVAGKNRLRLQASPG